MSLSAWEQRALNSIKAGLAGSDPELTGLLSAFNRLASDEEMPAREKIRVGSRPARRRLRSARWLSRVQRVVLVLSLLLTAVTAIAVVLALNVGGKQGTCTDTVVMACTGPAQAPGHGPASPSHSTMTGNSPQQGDGLPQAGP